MPIEETIVTEAIATTFFEKFKSAIDLDVAIVGAGPSGLTCAWKLSEKGLNVAIFERKLSIGGGMWGGGVTWNIIVVQEEGKHILDEAGIPCKEYKKRILHCRCSPGNHSASCKSCPSWDKNF